MFRYKNLPIYGCVLRDHLYRPEYGLGYRLRDFGYRQKQIGRDETFGIVHPVFEYHLQESPEELAAIMREKGFYPKTELEDLVGEINSLMVV